MRFSQIKSRVPFYAPDYANSLDYLPSIRAAQNFIVTRLVQRNNTGFTSHPNYWLYKG